jgi:GNAT superfamily N-acetyltransferase
MIEIHGRPEVVQALVEGERPGPDAMLGHVVRSGLGAVLVDRWPEPALVVARTGDNMLLRGDPDVLRRTPGLEVHGWVSAAAPFEPVLRTASERFTAWERMVFTLGESWPPPTEPVGPLARRLGAGDGSALEGMDPAITWIHASWPSAEALAASGHAWGAFAGGRLVAVACSFFVGARHEDIGVVTDPDFRGQGLSTALAGRVVADILVRGRRPCWTTWWENEASRRTAAAVGFDHHHDEPVFLVGIDPPE